MFLYGKDKAIHDKRYSPTKETVLPVKEAMNAKV